MLAEKEWKGMRASSGQGCVHARQVFVPLRYTFTLVYMLCVYWININCWSIGEVAEQLNMYTTLTEDQVYFPAPTTRLPVTPVLGDIIPSSGLHGYLCSCTSLHRHTQFKLRSFLKRSFFVCFCFAWRVPFCLFQKRAFEQRGNLLYLTDVTGNWLGIFKVNKYQ